ncbi:MAG: HTTM domain-containing protein [Frankiaceae bacterium]|nr:HTTM domain-containing protein [Frankiaceae bacterium]
MTAATRAAKGGATAAAAKGATGKAEFDSSGAAAKAETPASGRAGTSSVAGALRPYAGTLISRLFWLVIESNWALYRRLENWLTGAKRARYGLAIGRFLVGGMMVGAALTNIGTAQYGWSGGAAWNGQADKPVSDFAYIWPFSLVNRLATDSVGIYLVFFAVILFAGLFAIGYRAKLMMIPLFVFWIGLLSVDTLFQDQSDNLTRISMIGLLFTAPSEVWSVDAWRRRRSAGNPGTFFLVRWWRAQPALPAWFTALMHNVGVIALGFQLAGLYFWAGLYKAQGSPWYYGYAIYNPIHTVQFGTWPWLSDLLTHWGPMVGIASVATIIVQVTFPVALLRRGTRVAALVTILIFHMSIGIVMGLPWFSLAMVALDSIFIRDKTYREVADSSTSAWRAARGLPPRAAAPVGAVIAEAPPLGPIRALRPDRSDRAYGSIGEAPVAEGAPPPVPVPA